MKVKNLLLLIAMCFFSNTYAQSNTCESPNDEPLLDLNSITKCSVDNKDKEDVSRKVSVVVTSRKRVVRKRNAKKGINNNYEHKLSSLKKKNEITNSLSISNANGLKIVPFDFTDQIPLFKDCESAPIMQQKKCFKKELSNHINKHLKYPEDAYDKRIQGRVLVYFTINKDGSIGKTKIKAPYKGELLATEAERIINKLPKFKPGKHNGTPVTVKYGLPITFKIPGVKPSNIKKASERIELKEVYNFNQVSQIPQFKVCKNNKDNSQSCFNKGLIEHIEDNFAYPVEAIDNDIEGTVNVNFVIDTKGNIVNILAKGPENGKILENAAIKLIEKLPKFSPAKKDGKKVNTRYGFPVKFTLD